MLLIFNDILFGDADTVTVSNNSPMAMAILNLLIFQGRQDMVFRKIVKGEYDPDTGMGDDIVTEQTCTGMFIEFKDDLIGKGSIQQGDRKALISALTIDQLPTNDDKVILDNEVYNIIRVKKIAQNNNPIAYICQVRV